MKKILKYTGILMLAMSMAACSAGSDSESSGTDSDQFVEQTVKEPDYETADYSKDMNVVAFNEFHDGRAWIQYDLPQDGVNERAISLIDKAGVMQPLYLNGNEYGFIYLNDAMQYNDFYEGYADVKFGPREIWIIDENGIITKGPEAENISFLGAGGGYFLAVESPSKNDDLYTVSIYDLDHNRINSVQTEDYPVYRDYHGAGIFLFTAYDSTAGQELNYVLSPSQKPSFLPVGSICSEFKFIESAEFTVIGVRYDDKADETEIFYADRSGTVDSWVIDGWWYPGNANKDGWLIACNYDESGSFDETRISFNLKTGKGYQQPEGFDFLPVYTAPPFLLQTFSENNLIVMNQYDQNGENIYAVVYDPQFNETGNPVQNGTISINLTDETFQVIEGKDNIIYNDKSQVLFHTSQYDYLSDFSDDVCRAYTGGEVLYGDYNSKIQSPADEEADGTCIRYLDKKGNLIFDSIRVKADWLKEGSEEGLD